MAPSTIGYFLVLDMDLHVARRDKPGIKWIPVFSIVGTLCGVKLLIGMVQYRLVVFQCSEVALDFKPLATWVILATWLRSRWVWFVLIPTPRALTGARRKALRFWTRGATYQTVSHI